MYVGRSRTAQVERAGLFQVYARQATKAAASYRLWCVHSTHLSLGSLVLEDEGLAGAGSNASAAARAGGRGQAGTHGPHLLQVPESVLPEHHRLPGGGGQEGGLGPGGQEEEEGVQQRREAGGEVAGGGGHDHSGSCYVNCVTQGYCLL